MQISDLAVLELTELSREAEKLAAGNASDRARASALLSRCANIRQTGISSLEARQKYASGLAETTSAPKLDEARHRKLFTNYLRTGDDLELRDWLSGQQTITWTQGGPGGYTVPQTMDAQIRTAMAATDPLLDDSVIDLKINPGPFVQPRSLAGYDLTSIAAVPVLEASVSNPVAVPTVSGAHLRSDLCWRINFASSVEFLDDAIDGTGAILRAAGVALARGVGRSMVSGRGSTDILGLSQQLTSSGSNATEGKITATDITTWFFSIDPAYRNSEAKASWLVSDGTAKLLRQATDGQGRPLIDMTLGDATLMGAPVRICPSLSNLWSSIGVTGCLLWGSMSHIVARFGAVTIQNVREQSQHGIDIGEQMFCVRMRGDSTIHNPDSTGLYPPIRLFTIN